ncbi:MAG TPA: histidine kinase [Chitinophagaceae bacterium]|nr:histidine kinase [Chitinophagaceae bacterium]
MKQLIVFWMLLLASARSSSQAFSYRSVCKDFGFPYQRVNFALKDTKGYYWIAGSNGLYRWDSKKWKYFGTDEGLPNAEVLNLYEDSRKRLWIMCNSDELCYYEQGKIYTPKNDPRLGKLGIFLGSYFFENKGQLFFTNHDRSGYKTDLDLSPPGRSGIHSESIIFDHDSIVQLGHNNKGIAPPVALHIPYDQARLQPIDRSRWTTSNRSDLSYTVHWGLDSVEYKGHFQSSDIRQFYFNRGYPIEVYKHSLYLTRSRQTIHFKGRVDQVICLNPEFFVITDEDIFLFRESPVTRLNQDHPADENVVFLLDYQDKLFALMQNGRLISANDGRQRIQLPERAKSPIYNYYNAYKDREGCYITTSDSIYYIRNLSDIRGIHNPGGWNYKYFTGSSVPGQYYFNSSRDGIFRLLKSGGKEVIQRVSKTNEVLATLFEDSRKRLWYSTLNKVFFIRTGDTAGRSVELKLDAEPLNCRHIYEDRYRNLFFATNRGVYVYNGQSVTHLSSDNILSDNDCRKLVIDSNDNSLWVATQHGLNHLNYTPGKEIIAFRRNNIFFKDDGLPSDEITDLLLHQHRLYIGTPKGIVQTEQFNFHPAPATVPLYIETVRINDREYQQDALTQLQHDQNNIAFDISVPYFQRSSRFRLTYRLINHAEDTISGTIADGRLQLIALREGSYQLIIYGYDQDYPYVHSEVWDIPFSIAPVFYRTWWFRCIMLLTLILACAAVAYYYFRRQHEKLSFENKLAHLKLEALKAEMNPHFIFNSLNAIKDFIAQNDQEKSQYYLSRFAKLIRQALYNTRHEMVYLEDELKFIDVYVELEQMRFPGRFDYRRSIGLQDSNAYEIPTMFLQPFIENAIRHGRIGQMDRKGILELSIEGNEKEIIITISDNGIGIEAAQAIASSNSPEHRSMALSIINDRMAIYNKTAPVNLHYEISSPENNEYNTQVKLYIQYTSL